MLHLATTLVLAPLARVVYRPVIEGRANVPRRGPAILASNHLSFVDSVVIPLVAPRRVVFLAKAEYFQGPGIKGRLTRWMFTGLGSVPVDRAAHRAAQASLEAALDVLHAGDAFGIYPEGTRRDVTDRIMRAIAELSKQERAGTYNDLKVTGAER